MNIENENSELFNNLETIAYQKSKPFCYTCYISVKGIHCQKCGSNDNMRLLEGYGVEYGTDWIIEQLISENCSPVDEDFAEESLRDCYPETVKVGWVEVDPIDAIKRLDPISFQIAVNEHIDMLKEDNEIIEIAGEDYWRSDIQKYICDNLKEEVV